jgi:thiol-disulfide isomerase/thioredoxin
MKKLLISLFLITATAASTLAMNYEQAKQQDKPIVVMFHMHGCGACRKFSPIFDKYSSTFSNKFNFVKEDIDNSQIASKLNDLFDTVPAIFIIQPKTEQATRISNDCAWDKECLTKTLNEY